MAALRSAARRVLGGQAPRTVYRATFAEERQRLSPAFIKAASSVHPRRFSSQGGDDDPLTSEEKMRLFKRGAHLIFRMTKAISTVVACGIVIKWSVTEVFRPYPTSDCARAVRKCREMLQGLRGNPPALEVGPVLGDEMLAAEVAEFKSMVKDMKREAAERLED
ncbi:hypothetical protein CFC21_046202 [Triticum aestivum]|uniref:Uncharacterized protein n=2 Tax=Triticum aestivum TaxID=4565 RepID=A0A3B6GP75_WHEAT|nr:uncharacterized protein LOC109777404 [Aegilops tauschii subsp. strangulata]XP_044355601.1 uncharacterized protein LOC123077396 isoform X2 [Triticum aestivum]KAF7035291.1 hypothetical protein CFC21_046202 [Triticum aestivum]